MYGTQLEPTRDILTRHAVRDDRVINTVTQPTNTPLPNPSGQTLFRFPSLSQDMVVVPGSVRLVYGVTLTRETSLTARFVCNLGRAIIDRLTIRMQGKEHYSLQSYGDFWAISDFH